MTTVRTSLFDLTGKVAIVTGSTRGIGLACAEALAASGAFVVVSSENAEATAEAAGRLVAMGLTAVGIVCDVTRPEQLAALIGGAIDAFGRLDILVANAGVTLEEGPLADVSADAYDKMMAINLHSTVRLCNLAAPRIASGGGGAIVLMSSLAGMRGNRRLGVYAMTKAAVGQLARNLAVEWGHAGIRANAVAPGLIDTDFAAPLRANPQALDARLARTPLARMGRPEEVAGTVVFLASAAGGFVTGQTIVVDGGTLIGD